MINFQGFIDTTFRDGQASPLLYDTGKYKFSLSEKKQIIDALIQLGVTHFEFFSPVVSEKEKNDFIEIKKYIQLLTSKKITLLAHCRCHPQDINQALEIGFNGLNLYIGLSDRAQYGYGKDLDQINQIIKKSVIDIRKKHPNIWLRYSGEDAFRTPLKNLFKIYDEIAPYVDTFGIPDTTGSATPTKVKSRIRAFKKRYPKINLECHFHNDRGLALINTLEAVKNGAEFIDSSIWGMAERSGITSITGALLNLYYLDKKLTSSYQLQLCYPINVLMASILNCQVPWQEPVSLTNRTHIAGVHQKAVLHDKENYEAHHLEKFGVSKNNLLLGPLTGWNYIYYYLKEVENYLITPEIAKNIAHDFKNKVNQYQRKADSVNILKKLCQKYALSQIFVPERYQKVRFENFR